MLVYENGSIMWEICWNVIKYDMLHGMIVISYI